VFLVVLGLWQPTPLASASYSDDASAQAADRRIDRWSSLTTLSTEPDLYRIIEEERVFEEGPLRLTLTDGVVVPVFSGRFGGAWYRDSKTFLREQRAAGRPDRLPSTEDRGSRAFVGFVLTDATATVQVRLDDRADAQVLANRLVRFGLSERDAVRALAHGEQPLTVSLDTGVFLGTDPRLQRLFVGPSWSQPDNPERDVFSVVVYGERKGLGRAISRAENVLERRLRLYDRLRLELPESIALERYDGVAWQDSGRHLLMVDLKTDQRYGLISASPSTPGDEDSWLALLRDDSGQWDDRRQWSVRSLGQNAQGRPISGLLGGVPFPRLVPEDPTSAPRPLVGVEPVLAEARILAVPKDQGTLKVDMVSELTVAARGAPLTGLRLEIPYVQAEPDSWKLLGVTLPDGTSLSGTVPVVDERELERARQRQADEDKERQREDREQDEEDSGEQGRDRGWTDPPGKIWSQTQTVSVWFFFPEPVPAGESITFQVHHEDTWGLRTWQTCGPRIDFRSMGDATGLIFPLPILPGQALGNSWPVRLRVAVPDGSGLRAAASGATTVDSIEKGWRLVEARHDRPAAWPGVSIGRWHTQFDPPAKGLPAVRTHLFGKGRRQLTSVGQQVRQIALYYRGWLPDFPLPEIDVFESPGACGGLVWIAPHGMIQLQRMIVEDTPGAGPSDRFFEEGLLSHEVAHTWWGHIARPASQEDMWLAESMAEGFSCMYLGKVAGAKVCDKRMRSYQRAWEKDLPNSPAVYELPGHPEDRASLTEAYSSPFQPAIVYRYGPFVMHEMLRRKVGTEAYFKALDGVLRLPGPVTTERLHTALELTSGQDLDDFFDFWVYGGFIPKVELTWWVDEQGRLAGELTSDVPFGTFEIPVVLDDGEQQQELWVKVTDGRGELAGPVLGSAKVDLDPERRIIARKRRVKRR